MERVINLLKSERERTKHLIEFFKKEIETGKKAIEELQSPEFIEKHKDSSNWSEDWTMVEEHFYRLNVSSNNRDIAKYSKKLEETNEYLNQVERALAVLDEATAKQFIVLREKYADAVKELEGRR